MTAQIIRGSEVNRPEPDALTSTVLDHATVEVVDGGFGYRNNEGLWPSYNCLDLLTPTAACPEPMVGTKTFKRAEWVPAFEFAVYGGVECSNVGLDRADQMRETQRVFERSEGKGIEMALLLTRFVASEVPGSDAPLVDPTRGQWDDPVDLSAAGMSLVGALAALEGYAAAVYAGIPTLHMPRAAVTILFGQGLITERDGKFYTKAGSKVAAGGGYDSTEVPDGTYDLYATGEVYVEMSDKIEMQQYVIPGDGSGTGSDENGLADNTSIAFAERMYRVGIDCFVAKATGRAWGAA